MPDKNFRSILGKPLIVRTFEQAQASALFDTIIFSSDSEPMLDYMRNAGTPYVVMRPKEMANDTSSKLPPILHAVAFAEDAVGEPFETIVDLDVTSPLRSIDDIRGSVELMETSNVTNVITGSVARKNPYFNLVERNPDGSVGLSKTILGGGARIARRQSAPVCFDMNAAVYGWQRDPFFAQPEVFYTDTLLFEMPEARSYDIDSPIDFEIVKFLMERDGET